MERNTNKLGYQIQSNHDNEWNCLIELLIIMWDVLIANQRFVCLLAEAEAKYKRENIKIYQSTFNNMYFAMTERKEKTKMKLICAGPEEKVRVDELQW